MPKDYKKIAEAIRAAGVPDCLNRYLTMTPSELDHALAKAKPAVKPLEQKRGIEMKEAAGGKADQVRALRERRARPAIKPPAPITGEPPAATAAQKANGKASAAVKAEAPPPAERQPKATAKAEQKAAIETPSASAAEVKESSTMRKSNLKTKTTKTAKSAAKSSARRPAKSANARKPVSDAAPSGKAADIGKLASRVNGASRQELIELTGWSQQAWKWYFVNSKGNGFCQRFGYKLEVIEGKDGETRYKIVKK